jgi:alkyl hydroperoxide reductase subunit AhpC
VILVFHPPDWRPTHDDQVVLYPEIPTRPHGYHAQVASMPVNGIRNHFAFTPDRKIQLSALSDFGLRGAAARTYGAHCHQDGTSERTHYLTDTKCIIRWSYVSPLNVNPGMDGILTPLEGLNT